jgi:hypothetical protein
MKEGGMSAERGRRGGEEEGPGPEVAVAPEEEEEVPWVAVLGVLDGGDCGGGLGGTPLSLKATNKK